jgi:hypothetical protein
MDERVDSCCHHSTPGNVDRGDRTRPSVGGRDGQSTSAATDVQHIGAGPDTGVGECAREQPRVVLGRIDAWQTGEPHSGSIPPAGSIKLLDVSLRRRSLGAEVNLLAPRDLWFR